MRLTNTKEKITHVLYNACQRGEAYDIQKVATLLNTINQHYHHTAGNKHILDEIINSVFPKGSTMLLVACEGGHGDIVRILIDTLLQVNADVTSAINHHNTLGNNAIMIAILQGNTQVVQMLIKALQGANDDIRTTLRHKNSNGKSAYDLAFMKRNREIMSSLIDAYIRALNTPERNHYLIECCGEGKQINVEQIIRTLDTREKIESAMHHRDQDGNTALMHAVENGHRKIVKLLVDTYQNANADMATAINNQNIDGDTALMCAADSSFSDNEEVVTILLNALQNGNIDVANAISQQNIDGDTALTYAARGQKIGTIRILLKTIQNTNANIANIINHINGVGHNALMSAVLRFDAYAVAPFDAEVVKLLLVHGGTCENETVNRMISTILTGDSKQKIPRDKLETLLLDGDISWVNDEYTHFNNRNREEKNTLHALASWGVIVGNHAFVKHMIALIGGSLTPAEHTEYVRLALHTQRLPIVQTLLDHIVESDTNQASNRQAILNYLLHLMVIEEGPLPSIEFLLEHGATPKSAAVNDDNTRTELTLLTQHTVLQVQKVCKQNPAHNLEAKQSLLGRFTSIMAQRECSQPEGIAPQDIALRMQYYKKQVTCYHHLAYKNKLATIRAIQAHISARVEQNREAKPAKRLRR